MTLWEQARRQCRVYGACLLLYSDDPVRRAGAIDTLVVAGPSALPLVRLQLLHSGEPKGRFAAAVAVHRLHHPDGMRTLLESLEGLMGVSPKGAPLLEEAFTLIGSPDATAALQAAWERPSVSVNTPLPPLDYRLKYQIICRVWAATRDPKALDTLFAHAASIPLLFPPTVASYGQLALRRLGEAAQTGDPEMRLLAARTLERIPGPSSWSLLAALLRDPDAVVRAGACEGLMRGGSPKDAAEQIARAVRSGYSTLAAVHALEAADYEPRRELYLELIARTGSPGLSANDAPGVVNAVLRHVMESTLSPECRLDLLCTVLAKPVGRDILLASMLHVESLPQRRGISAPRVQALLWNLLADPAPEVRAGSARALAAWGDTEGRRFLDMLAEFRPRGSFLGRLTTLLRGGPDASHAATAAVQQMQQWMTKVSRETTVRLLATGVNDIPSSAGAADSPRFGPLLRTLLRNAIREIEMAGAGEEAEEALSVAIAATRGLRARAAAEAEPELLRALYLTRTAPFAIGHPREVCEPLREEAALALMDLSGSGSLGIFLKALSAESAAVQGTAALALGRLGDPRAVPALQQRAADSESPIAAHAAQAIAAIRQRNPEMMTLLRGSYAADASPETLLRPLPFTGTDASPDLLLRPASNGETGL